jgi:tetraacyldisaccharide 4'-kinase
MKILGKLLRSIYLGVMYLIRQGVLRPLSWLFAFIVFWRGKCYQWGIFSAKKLPVMVISIGNISTGGTGKTPMAEFLMRLLIEKGWHPAYLSRGYGRQTIGFRLVNAQKDSIEAVGDEALQVANKFPQLSVAVCEDRVRGVESLLQQSNQIDCIILDDAFQHRAIARDFDLVMLDGNRPPWRDHFLPFGRLREPQSAFKRADLVVVNKIVDEDKIRSFQRHITQKIAFTRTLPQELVPFYSEKFDKLEVGQANKRVCVLFSGIGNNEHFLLEVRKLGIVVMRNYRFSDHHKYRAGEIEKIVRRYKRLVAEQYAVASPIIITTEKDYFRLRKMDWFEAQFADVPFYYLTITLEIIRGKDIFDACLDALLSEQAESKRIAHEKH